RQNMLSMNSYYTYFPLAMFLVGLYALWSSRPAVLRARRERLASILQAAIVVGLMILSLSSACKVRAMSDKIAEEHRPLCDTVKFLDRLVREHRNDSRFALAFSPTAWQRLDSFGDRYVLRVPLPVLICPCALNYDNPTHVVTFVNGTWQAVQAER